MSAIDELYSYYADSGRDIGDDLDWYARHGYVMLSPTLCIMARPVCGEWSEGDIIGLRTINPLTEEPNAWLIHIMAGSLRDVLANIPYHLPGVLFQRNGGRLRKYQLERTLHGIRQQTKNTTSTSTSSPES